MLELDLGGKVIFFVIRELLGTLVGLIGKTLPNSSG